MERLKKEFFDRSCLLVAPELVGKLLCRKTDRGEILMLRITETEAYNGTADTACHASKGKTPRSELLWREAGTVYIYLCYGIHWMLNVVTGAEGDPQCVLIRGVEGYGGPGKLTKFLEIGKALNGSSIPTSEKLWIADDGFSPKVRAETRIGIDYAAPQDRGRLWRFLPDSDEEQ